MAELTLEALAQRVEALERAMTLRLKSDTATRTGGASLACFGESEFMRQVDAEGQAIREAERAEAQRLETAG